MHLFGLVALGSLVVPLGLPLRAEYPQPDAAVVDDPATGEERKRPRKPPALKLGELPLARVVADDKVGDHHAIIPTDGPQDLSGIGPDERKIYDLVARRFLATL